MMTILMEEWSVLHLANKKKDGRDEGTQRGRKQREKEEK